MIKLQALARQHNRETSCALATRKTQCAPLALRSVLRSCVSTPDQQPVCANSASFKVTVAKRLTLYMLCWVVEQLAHIWAACKRISHLWIMFYIPAILANKHKHLEEAGVLIENVRQRLSPCGPCRLSCPVAIGKRLACWLDLNGKAKQRRTH